MGADRHSEPGPAGGSSDPESNVADYCREIETYLCRKNDGHLIRVVGPSFEIVSRWARTGIPIKVAFGGIDRYFERYYRKGPRRRPVRIDFCEADVLDLFDEWRRATGLTAASVTAGVDASPAKRGPSLPEHLERVLTRLSTARATGVLGAEADPLIDRLSSELDRARGAAGGLRGEARKAMTERLAAADSELLSMAKQALAAELDELRRAATAALGSLIENMAPEARERARERALDQWVRDRLHLPIVSFS